MYGKLNERKLREQDYQLSCESVRKELESYIDSQNRRVNIDSAKKLAVMQHMDYQGFRQMVLGANIFPSKSKELIQFSKGSQPNNLNPNKAFEQGKHIYKDDVQERVEGNSQKYCFNFRQFKKKFMKFYDKELTSSKAEECYSLIKQQDKTRVEKIFNLECEADILVKIIDIFSFVRQYLANQQKSQSLLQQTGFMLKYLQMVLSIPTMQDISINILTKKQKQKIALFIQACKQQADEEISCKLIKLIKL